MAREATERPHSFAGVNSCADERMSCGEWAEDANPGLFRVSVIGKNISPHRKGKEHERRGKEEGSGARRPLGISPFSSLTVRALKVSSSTDAQICICTVNAMRRPSGRTCDIPNKQKLYSTCHLLLPICCLDAYTSREREKLRCTRI